MAHFDGIGLPLDESLFGLRNLAKDEDEEQISDYVDLITDPDVRTSVQRLIEKKEFGEAYELAIRPTIEKMERTVLFPHVVRFAQEFVTDDDVVEKDSYRELEVVKLVDVMFEEWDRLRSKWWKPSEARERPEGWEEMEEVLDVTKCLELLQLARDNGIKLPKARFIGPDLKDIRLSLAGPRSVYPEGMEVRTVNTHIGTILPNGFVIGVLAKERKTLDTLIAIGEDLAGAAKIYADFTNTCPFCLLPFYDDASRLRGYSEHCGRCFGLPV